MQALWMLLAALLFAVMGALVKLAVVHHGIAEIVFYRSLLGIALLGAWGRWHGLTLRPPLAWLHLRRSALGILSLSLWFYALSLLPLGTATTLNYTSSLFLALFAIGMAVVLGRPLNRVLVGTITAGFVGAVQRAGRPVGLRRAAAPHELDRHRDHHRQQRAGDLARRRRCRCAAASPDRARGRMNAVFRIESVS